MGFAQLYYTSCESGLSDFAGFQFNAATPGVPLPVLREVEALTSYEPPRSLGYRPSAAEIAACPVNLVYRCEPTTVLANVVFVGLDFSQRLGNYFAHALVGQDDTDRFDEILPIELWGSPVWAGEPVAGRELPALAGLPEPTARAGISRAGVDRFLARTDRAEQLTALVSAAETAVLRQGRSIVIIEDGSTAAAHWIAAISFLLPPAVARRMSFATYRHRPEYSDAHVIATLPDSDFDLDDATFHSYVVFDAASGRISEVTPEPAVALLVRVGAERAAGLWARVTALLADNAPVVPESVGGASAERTDKADRVGRVSVERADRTEPADIADVAELADLAQCRPVLVAAAVLAGLPVTPAELETLGGWVRSSPGALRPDDRLAVLEAVRGHLAELVDDDPDTVIDVFSGSWGGLMDDGALPVALRRAALLARCRRDLLAPDPGPDGTPNPPAMGTAGNGVHPLGGTRVPARDWLVQAIVTPARDGSYLPAYRILCRAIEDGTVTVSLPGAAQAAVSSFLVTTAELERAENEQDQASTLWRLAGSYPQQGATVQDLLRVALPGLIDRLAGSRLLVDAVANCPEPVVAAYLETARQRAGTDPPDIAGTTVLFQTLQTLRAGQDPVLAPELDEVLRRSLRSWPADDLDRLRDSLQRTDSELAAGFTGWRGRWLGSRLGRSLRRLVGGGR